MSYQIDAALQQGIPSLRLLDATSGRERLFWQLPVTGSDTELRGAWHTLFRRLALLSCVDHMGGNSRQQIINITGCGTSIVRHDRAVASPRAKTAPVRQSNVVYLPLSRVGAGR